MLEPVFALPWWGYVLVALGLTHITIVCVTLYLHRCQAHRALQLHPAVAHFCRFWLWITTAQVTREWIAVHRKHHARVETAEDPHSPQVYGLNRVLWGGAFLYHKESLNQATLSKFGVGAPDDWLERHVYTPRSYLGPAVMLAIDFALFGVAGLAIWLVQMVWTPFWAAGVINGVGHYFGYRNYEVSDASRNIVPWGILIGGEELHNNHHAFASSARFSARPWEIDIGWWYLRALAALGLAKIKKIPPEIICNPTKQQCDMETVRAVLGNRFQVKADFVREVVTRVWREESSRIRSRVDRERWSVLRRARRLLVRDHHTLDPASRTWLSIALDNSPRLTTVYQMKQRLHDIWNRSSGSHEHLLKALDDWCRAAEASGVEALRQFSRRLRGYTLRATA